MSTYLGHVVHVSQSALTFGPGGPTSPPVPGSPESPWLDNKHTQRQSGAAAAKFNTVTVIICPTSNAALLRLQ